MQKILAVVGALYLLSLLVRISYRFGMLIADYVRARRYFKYCNASAPYWDGPKHRIGNWVSSVSLPHFFVLRFDMYLFPGW